MRGETPCLPRKTFPLGRYRAARAPNPPGGGRSRQTPVWPLRWVGRPRRHDLGQAVFWRGRQARSPLPIRRSGVASAAARWRLAAVAGGGFRAICVPRLPLACRRMGAPCGLAPRLGLRTPSAAASPSPSLYLLDASATRADEDNAAGRSVLALHRSGSPGGLAPPRTFRRESVSRQTPSKVCRKRPPKADGGAALPDIAEDRSFFG